MTSLRLFSVTFGLGESERAEARYVLQLCSIELKPYDDINFKTRDEIKFSTSKAYLSFARDSQLIQAGQFWTPGLPEGVLSNSPCPCVCLCVRVSVFRYLRDCSLVFLVFSVPSKIFFCQMLPNTDLVAPYGHTQSISKMVFKK